MTHHKETVISIIYGILRHGWHTPYQVQNVLYDKHEIFISDAACTARIRDLRKPRYGGHTIAKRRYFDTNSYEYHLVRHS